MTVYERLMALADKLDETRYRSLGYSVEARALAEEVRAVALRLRTFYPKDAVDVHVKAAALINLAGTLAPDTDAQEGV